MDRDPMHEAYDEVYVHELEHGGPSFPLQHVVDAFAAQTATSETKPIAITFALVGLYLHLEKGYSGRQVQLVHMQLGKTKRPWPAIALPEKRGEITAIDVAAVPAGAERNLAIEAWCRSVWAAFDPSRDTVVRVLRDHRIT